jgi:hypothetical protein
LEQCTQPIYWMENICELQLHISGHYYLAKSNL